MRGPWITGDYFADPSPEKFDNGWLRTGDVGSVNAFGYVQITDRAKDVIKSGGEWISSVELENHLMAHPDVVEASVIGVPDPRWEERPLACVVRKSGSVGRRRRARRVSLGAGREVAGARTLELHRRGSEDERRQVRQEGAARPPREGRARGRVAGLMPDSSKPSGEQERLGPERPDGAGEIAGMPRDAQASGAAAAPAATVILIRDGQTGLEVLLTRRSSQLAFHGGAWVFPGGRIDPEDYADAPDDVFGAARRAAAREAKEEAGLDVHAAHARAPVELDDARDLAQAFRHVVLRGRGGRR